MSVEHHCSNDWVNGWEIRLVVYGNDLVVISSNSISGVKDLPVV